MDMMEEENEQLTAGSRGSVGEAGHREVTADSKMEFKVSVASVSARKPSARASATSAVSGFAILRTAASIISRMSGSVLSGRGPTRSRSMMSIPGLPGTSSRASIASRGSRSSRVTCHSTQFDYGLSPGLQQLIERLADTKDVGLIAYLSAIPGQPHQATKPPTAIVRLQRKQSSRPKSIMKISKPQVRFEPTYCMEPMRPFKADRAHAMVRGALEMGMAGATYSGQWATDACRILAAYITQCIKGLETQAPGSRYKISTMVSVLERNWQGARSELNVLWDPDRDRYVAASVETSTMIAYAVVYAVYWD